MTNRILVVLTGGTICSTENEEGKRFSDAANVKIVEAYKNSASPFAGSVTFDTVMPCDTLSENMTVSVWNTLLGFFKNDVDASRYDGVIVLHGTDTLALTASLFGLTLSGFPIPVCMVSAQLPLHHDATNGHANFRVAVELIENGIAPNIYAVYRNSDGVMYAHLGTHLRQCGDYSEDFFSADAMSIKNTDNATLAGVPFETDTQLFLALPPLAPCVLYIAPFVGIDYDMFDLTSVKAIVHGTYHSQTVCVERKNGSGNYSPCSILHLADRCRSTDTTLLLTPCDKEAYCYESTSDILSGGAFGVCGMTTEAVVVKTIIGCALSLSGENLAAFVSRPINREML